MLGVVESVDAGVGAVEEVAGVELDAGLGGVDGEGAAGAGIGDDDGRFGEGVRSVEDPVVVVAAGELELLVLVVDAGADGGRGAEVEGSAGHGRQIAGGDELVVGGSVFGGVDLEDVAKDVAGAGRD